MDGRPSDDGKSWISGGETVKAEIGEIDQKATKARMKAEELKRRPPSADSGGGGFGHGAGAGGGVGGEAAAAMAARKEEARIKAEEGRRQRKAIHDLENKARAPARRAPLKQGVRRRDWASRTWPPVASPVRPSRLLPSPDPILHLPPPSSRRIPHSTRRCLRRARRQRRAPASTRTSMRASDSRRSSGRARRQPMTKCWSNRCVRRNVPDAS